MALHEDIHVGVLRADQFKVGSHAAIGDVAFTVGTEDTNVVSLTVTLKDGHGNVLKQASAFNLFFSDSATTLAVCTTAPSGGMSASVGNIVKTITTGKDFVVATASTGIFTGAITESSGKTLYAVVVSPMTGEMFVSGALTWA